jgi:hypothetical protein
MTLRSWSFIGTSPATPQVCAYRKRHRYEQVYRSGSENGPSMHRGQIGMYCSGESLAPTEGAGFQFNKKGGVQFAPRHKSRMDRLRLSPCDPSA